VTWEIIYTPQAVKDAKKLKQAGLAEKAKKLITFLKKNPLQNPPPFKKLVGDFTGTYSRRINIQHRLVYQLYKKEKIVKIIRMWTHYE